MSDNKRQLWEPYLRLLRLHQPTGVFLLLWPCWWTLALAANGNPSPWLLTLFAVGALVMRAAGCIVNDIADREFDRKVERTRIRPLASGEISVAQALILLLLLLIIALCIALMMNRAVIITAAVSLLLVFTYPFMKRITWWPQAFLGLTFNWGALMGWVAVRNHIELPAVILYIGCIFWTLGYDTIYAHQDKADDIKAGVKSTALLFLQSSKKWIAAFYALAIFFWLCTGIILGKGSAYYVGLFLVALHFVWQMCTLNIDDAANCMKIFRSNSVLGLIMFLGCYV